MASEKVLQTDGASWQSDVVESELPVLVDFWASWCGPCRMIAPILDQLADELDGKIRIAKVDVDANQDLAGKLGIQSLPTLLVLKQGEEAERIIGAVSKDVLTTKIAPHIGAS